MTEHDKIKFRDDCAIAAMRLLYEEGIPRHISDKVIATNAFDLAEAMLEEKLKRDGGKDVK
jgi:hypothetical protein